MLQCTCNQPVHVFHPALLCRNDKDRLAFAVHAAIVANGFRLIGLGDDVKLEGKSIGSMCHQLLVNVSCLW